MTTQREQFQARRIKTQQDYIDDLEGTIRLLLRDLEFTESVGCAFAYDVGGRFEYPETAWLVDDMIDTWSEAVDEATGGAKKSAEDLVSL